MESSSFTNKLEIESKTRSYFDFKYPILYYLQFVSYPVFTIIWLFGIFLGLHLIVEESNFLTVFWLTGWLLAGLINYYLIWYYAGKQIICADSEGIRVTKKFMLYRRSKVVKTKRILTIDFIELKPYNIFTGRDIEIKERLGWLVINGDSNYRSNSYLYPIEDLEELIKLYLSVCKTAN
ncbi:hypothetical protein [Algoriphagus aquimarinus]|uniref:Uncharacterized protein n=1 Tax=Algoriphagus aquimarinus TaxID=237018 RepID=A0A1I0Y9J2_9BACT|nr:hypothetical protein [Algoriphagus aquimarinus]SFB09140.1 hypothetical protein SAMN04489723_104148 [Algoriphagus aquimarinus]